MAYTIAWGVTLIGGAAGLLPSVLGIAGVDGFTYDPATVVLTLTLGAVVWYTYFTYQALEETKGARERKRKRRKNELATLITRLLGQAIALTGRREDADPRFRNATIWTREDLRKLESKVAPFADGDLEYDIGEVTTDLQWIATRVRKVQETDPKSGYRWRDFPWEEWEEKLKSGLVGLLSMLMAVESTRFDSFGLGDLIEPHQGNSHRSTNR